MDAVISWIIANPGTALIIADAIVGAIPDKYISYVGGVRNLINVLHDAINR